MFVCKVPVLLPQERFQEIKCMMTVTANSLFLTCTQKFYLYIYTTLNQLLGPNPPCENANGNPTYLEGRCFARGGKLPFTLAPCLIATVHPLLSNPPHPFPTPSAHIMLQ
jgi:hypothetical protein